MARTLLALILASNVCYIAIVIRLRLKHRDRWADFDGNDADFLSPVRQVVRVVEMVATGKQAELRDAFLVVAGYGFIACFLISLPLMFIYVLN